MVRPVVPLKPPVVPWLAFWAGFAALDWWADRKGKSLSCAARHLFKTNHPAGRATFTIGLFGGALILWRHITK